MTNLIDSLKHVRDHYTSIKGDYMAAQLDAEIRRLEEAAREREARRERIVKYASIYRNKAFDHNLEEAIEAVVDAVEEDIQAAQQPREWASLEEIPDEVTKVRDRDGDIVVRKQPDPKGHPKVQWHWPHYDHLRTVSGYGFGPFQEIK